MAAYAPDVVPNGSLPARRTRIRLTHSLAADVEISAVPPDTLEEFDEALARGELAEFVQSLRDCDAASAATDALSVALTHTLE